MVDLKYMSDAGFEAPHPDLAPSVQNEQTRPPVNFGVKSIESAEHPDRNEDALFRYQRDSDGTIVAGVFDGASGKSGEPKGDVVSDIAMDVVSKYLTFMPDGIPLRSPDGKCTTEYVRKALQEANNSVRKHIEEGSGSTAAVVVACDALYDADQGNKDVAIGTVGDCRVYRLRNGELKLLTLDDTSVQEGREEMKAWELQGRLDRAVRESDLSAEDLAVFRDRKKVTQALDGQEIKPIVRTDHAKPGDRFLLTTNGIPNNLTIDEIQAVLATNVSSGMAIDELIVRTKARSKLAKSPMNIRSTVDDFTGIVFDIPKPIPNPDMTAVQKQGEHIPFADRFPEGVGAVFDGQEWKSTGRKDQNGHLIFRSAGGEFTAIDPYMLLVKGAFPLKPEVKVEAEQDKRTKPSDIMLVDFSNGTRNERRERLYDVVRRLQNGGLQGSKKFYPSLELLGQIQGVLDDPTDEDKINAVTNGQGSLLRQKLTDLVQIEKAEEDLH